MRWQTQATLLHMLEEVRGRVPPLDLNPAACRRDVVLHLHTATLPHMLGKRAVATNKTVYPNI